MTIRNIPIYAPSFVSLPGLKQFTDDIQKHMLEVKVMSFAYKKGNPERP